MGGYGALTRIRAYDETIAPPVIAITAGGMKEDIDKIKKAGFDDYLIRPFDQVLLVQMLKQNHKTKEIPILHNEILTPRSL